MDSDTDRMDNGGSMESEAATHENAPGSRVEIGYIDNLREGLYRDKTQNHIFYLSHKDGRWYMQYYWNKTPVLIGQGDKIYAENIDPKEVIGELKKEIRFIKSKLEKTVRSR